MLPIHDTPPIGFDRPDFEKGIETPPTCGYCKKTMFDRPDFEKGIETYSESSYFLLYGLTAPTLKRGLRRRISRNISSPSV